MKRDVRTSGPPNGGYGWVVCFAAFWTSGVVFGIQNNFAVTYVAILDSFPGADAFRTAWIGSLNWGLQHLCSPLAGILVDKIGCRKTSCLGAVLVFTGLMTSSFASRLEILYVTFGIITGTGMAIKSTSKNSFFYLYLDSEQVKHASLILPTYNNEVLVTCIGASSWAGRMFWGRIGDFPNVRRVRLHQMAFFVTGVCSTLVPVATHFAALATLTVVIGFFDGAYISLIGAIVYDMFGRKDASQAIGFNYGVCAVPLIIGMPLAGFIYDAQLSYQGTYFFAAAPMVLGACILFLIPKDNQSEMDRTMATDSEKRPLSSIEEYDETYAVAGYYNEKGHGDSKYLLITSPEEDYEVIFDRISSV
ncbi:monocarboxylate transporter 10-like [Branchiostoma lanceolatum]|uniref:monocarboxylate transporter 10-like n=1 Tax=Branchiostoma lanceolatum TaxID=7740 RepID=UPI003455764D